MFEIIKYFMEIKYETNISYFHIHMLEFFYFIYIIYIYFIYYILL